MALTVNSKDYSVFGNYAITLADFTFDSSYAAGGEAIDPGTIFGMHDIAYASIESQGAYSFQYDATNKKIKVYDSGVPPIVFEEQQTIASNAITLNYPPAFIMAVTQADSNVAICTSGVTLAASQCKPTAVFAEGARGGLTFHSGLSGVVYVTYVTQAWKDVWDNLVQEETQTPAAHVATLDNQAIAIQSVTSVGTTSTNCCLMIDKDDTVATTEVDIDMTSTTKTLTFAAADAVTSCVVTYIKKPASGFLKERSIAEEGLSASSNICTTAYPILIWGYANQLPENGQTTEVFINLAGTAGTAEAKLDLQYHTTRIIGQAVTTGTGMYVWGRPWEIKTVPVEVDGKDLSGVNVRAIFIGT